MTLLMRLKNQVGEYLVTAIIDEAESGSSPVSGKAFKKLSKEYAEREKGGDTTPNLDLNGSMFDAMTFVTTDSGVEVGIFDSEEAPKAYNHNVGDTLPKRQFIPQPDQKFVGFIDKEVKRIVKDLVKDYRDENFQPQEPPRTTPNPEPTTNVTVGFSIDSFVRNLLRGNQN